MDLEPLSAVLRAAHWIPPGAGVDAVSAERAGGGGALGTARRLTLTCNNGQSLSVIVKQARETIPQSAAMLEHEARAYETDIFAEAGVSLPRHLLLPDGPLAPALVLEDLGDSGFRRFKVGCTEREAYAAIGTAAALHAKHWRYPPGRYPWVPDAIDSAATRYCAESLDGFSAWPPALRRHAEFLTSHLGSIATRLTGGYTTIAHGDYHCLNLSFAELDGALGVTVIDLQLIQRATPMLDVSRFIVNSLRGGLRRRLDRKLLEHYHDRLVELGVEDYPRQRMIDDFRLGLIWNLAVPLALYAKQLPAVRSSIGDDLPLEREACDAMDDWDCLSLRL